MTTSWSGFAIRPEAAAIGREYPAAARRARRRPRPGAGSYEALFHAARRGRFLLVWNESDALAEQLRVGQLERAIGVIYRPDTERQSHYFRARLPEQFDAVIHFDETRALQPLETTAEWQAGEVPETFPFAV